ncbi:hypothetical protein D3C75_800260 [compost metagenome]
MMGEIALDDGGQQFCQVEGLIAPQVIRVAASFIEQRTDPGAKQASWFDEQSLLNEARLDANMAEQRVSGLIWVRSPIQRTALKAFLGVAQCILVSDLGQADGLHTDSQSRTVHEHKHAGKATVQFADAIALGILER